MAPVKDGKSACWLGDTDIEDVYAHLELMHVPLSLPRLKGAESDGA